MPPSSRKRNKGKDRKAKQLAKKEEVAHSFWRDGLNTISNCEHGFPKISTDNHPVSSFMDQFYMNSCYKNMNVKDNLMDLNKSHPQIFENEGYRKLVLAVLTRIGTNMLLGGVDVWPIILAHSIVFLEHYNDKAWELDDLGVIIERVLLSKWRDINIHASSVTRDCLKFFRKRISCKCLKNMHLEARKTTPKMGLCCNCNIEMERVLLSVCSRCMVYQYCSRECQVAHWSEHVRDCSSSIS